MNFNFLEAVTNAQIATALMLIAAFLGIIAYKLTSSEKRSSTRKAWVWTGFKQEVLDSLSLEISLVLYGQGLIIEHVALAADGED